MVVRYREMNACVCKKDVWSQEGRHGNALCKRMASLRLEITEDDGVSGK